MKPAFSLPHPLRDSYERLVRQVMDPRGLTTEEIGEALGWRVGTVRSAIYDLGCLIPGTLPPRVKIAMWAMGFTAAQITSIPHPLHHKSALHGKRP